MKEIIKVILIFSIFTTNLLGLRYICQKYSWNFISILTNMISIVFLFVGAWWSLSNISEQAETDKFVNFEDDQLEKKYRRAKMPVGVLINNYLHQNISLTGDVFQILQKHSDDFISFKPSIIRLFDHYKRSIMPLRETEVIDIDPIFYKYMLGEDMNGHIGKFHDFNSDSFVSNDKI